MRTGIHTYMYTRYRESETVFKSQRYTERIRIKVHCRGSSTPHVVVTIVTAELPQQ